MGKCVAMRRSQATMGLFEGQTALYFMIAQGDMKMVEWLHENKAR